MAQTKGNPERANYRLDTSVGVRVRVMCPVCGAGGGHPVLWGQPKCHVCTEPTLMLPASNNECVCSWEEAQTHAATLLGAGTK